MSCSCGPCWRGAAAWRTARAAAVADAGGEAGAPGRPSDLARPGLDLHRTRAPALLARPQPGLAGRPDPPGPERDPGDAPAGGRRRWARSALGQAPVEHADAGRVRP